MGKATPEDNKKKLSNEAAEKALIALQYFQREKYCLVPIKQHCICGRRLNLSLSSQLISSHDDVVFKTNQSECAALLAVVGNKFTFDLVVMEFYN